MERNPKQNEKLQYGSFLLTENLNRLWSSLIIDQLVQSGVCGFFVSPGMRNAPLLAAVEAHPLAKIYSTIDERSSGFRALGAAKASGKAAVLICTSGSAGSHYTPAMIEAYKSNINLIAITSDRPIELVEAGANQSIEQKSFYEGFLRNRVLLERPNSSFDPQALRQIVSKLFIKGGTSHINIPFDEPLDSTIVDFEKSYLDAALESHGIKAIHHSTRRAPSEAIQSIFEDLKKAKNPMIVIGPTDKNQLENLEELIQTIPCQHYLDVTSNLKYKFPISTGTIPSLDHPEVLETLKNSKIDYVLHLGGRIVSKQYYRFIQNKDISVNIVSDFDTYIDPSLSIKTLINSSLDDFSKELLTLPLNEIKKSNDFDWSGMVSRKSELIERAPLSYPFFSKTLIENIPSNSTLYLGNSTCIRSFDSFASLNLKKEIKVFSHRGASGIEGFMSSALGACEVLHTPVQLVLGDVSFLHDLNALILLAQNPNIKLRIYLLNNGGGGIFTLLPIHEKNPELMPYMQTPTDFDASKLCETFRINYKKISNKDELIEIQKTLPNQTEIVEVPISNNDNINLYKELKTVKP